MTAPDDSAGDAAIWRRALSAIDVFAVDPFGLGGIQLRSQPGIGRDRLVHHLQAVLPGTTPLRRVPVHVDLERLIGGLDLAATLKSGRLITTRGLLMEADGGVIMLGMAERVAASTAAQIAAALDGGATRFGVVALDEGIEVEERPPGILLERLALQFDLRELQCLPPNRSVTTANDVAAARRLLSSVTIPDAMVEALCATALQLGVQSMRASILAVRAARVAAALAGRTEVDRPDVEIAAQLVLAPRAMHAVEPSPDDAPEQSVEQPADHAQGARDAASELGDVVLAAARAVMPAGLFEHLIEGRERRTSQRSLGRAGARARSRHFGRPAGVRRGKPGAGARLNILETLRTAAPLQKVRAREAASSRASGLMSVQIRSEDFHVTRYRRRTATTTIFLLDASGSSALHRLAEAKGAVELLLAECYVRRDQVAVLAFRGKAAELLLPPTRSLVRARRSLAELPGGGGTPLAAGLEAGRLLVEAVARRGDTPTLVVLTDGSANIALDGSGGRDRAMQDAMTVARRLKAEGVRTVLIDTSPRPQQNVGPSLAQQLGAKYIALPHADAAGLAAAVNPRAVGR